jgi:hypothetical protein
VRRLVGWIAGLAGGAAALKLLSRRSPSPVLEPERDPAEELRAKLAESRGIVDERDEFEAGETTVDAAEPAVDPEERRRRVHEQGREALDEMRRRD